nr:GDSL-type esterase/lipase family protein [uncultured Acetatifactor sp.]
MRTRKHTTPLLSALAASMLCASLTAAVSAHGVFEKYDTDGWGQPIISVLMQGLAHRDSFWEPGGADAQDNSLLLASSQSNTGEIPDVLAGQREAAISGSVSGRQQDAGAAGSANGSGGSVEQHGTGAFGSVNGSGGSGNQQSPEAVGSGGQPGAGAAGSANGSGGSGNQQSPEAVGSGGQPGAGAAGSANPSGTAVPQQDSAPTGSGNNATSNPGSPQHTDAAVPGGSSHDAGSVVPDTTPGAEQNPDAAAQAEPMQYAFTEVPREYFDDALFIGDSRVTGVELYSGWDNLTYYAEGGMTVYSMFQSKTAQVEGQTLTIEEALRKRSFGKIYLEIGINEMGTGTVDSFMEAYEAAVDYLRELQPDAILYVCSIMYVEQSKSESDPIFNNPAIQERNDRIAALADGENIFYLDINEVVTDETGNLNPDYTWDEVHLLGKYDVIWLEYFSSHGIVKDS